MPIKIDLLQIVAPHVGTLSNDAGRLGICRSSFHLLSGACRSD